MIKTAFEYHLSTSYDRDKMGGHYLDWKNQPMVFKDYPGVLPFVLPAEVDFPGIALLDLIGEEIYEGPQKSLKVKDLSSIFRLSYSLTARARQGGGDFYFRSAASAGALYPCEIYVAAHGVDELEDGLYHFAVHRHCLFPLRRGDMTSFLSKHIQLEADKPPGLTFILSAIFYRSAWKYGERSYRYHLLDTGHLLENLILALRSLDLNPEPSYNFDDDRVNYLLGLDDDKEAAMVAVSISSQESMTTGDQKPLEKLPQSFSQASRVASREVDYPAVQEIHRAGKHIQSPSGPDPVRPEYLGLNIKKWTKIQNGQYRPAIMSFAEAVYQRRSKRNFTRDSLDRNQISALIEAVSQSDPDVDLNNEYAATFAIGIIVNQVEGMTPGFFLLETKSHSLGLVTSGQNSEHMARVCLDQAWLVNAALYVLFLTNLKLLEETWGSRGYRYAMMTAGRLGQRIYLLATAMGLGCCGIGAFYDKEASDLLHMNQDSRLLYLVALGPIKSRG